MTNLTKQRLLIGGAGVLATVAGFLAWKLLQSDGTPEQVNLPSQHNSIGMRFVKVPAGTFSMGSPKGEAGRDDDEEQHEVEITHSFWLSVHEVTQEQYERVMGSNPSVFRAPLREEGEGGPNHPVENVSWKEASQFCEKLAELPEEKAAGRRYRLPTEAEWEYACRAGKSGKAYSTGTELRPDQANTLERHLLRDKKLQDQGLRLKGSMTMKVGSFPPNAWGLFDMHGNVWEWCQDWYDPHYYRESPKKDPQGPESGIRRVIRGGSRADLVEVCRSANRCGLPPDICLGGGLRVVLVEEGK